jgi:hypothetical protein
MALAAAASLSHLSPAARVSLPGVRQLGRLLLFLCSVFFLERARPWPSARRFSLGACSARSTPKFPVSLRSILVLIVALLCCAYCLLPCWLRSPSRRLQDPCVPRLLPLFVPSHGASVRASSLVDVRWPCFTSPIAALQFQLAARRAQRPLFFPWRTLL